MRVTSKGQVTIPQGIRRKLGIVPSSEVDFVIEGNAVRIVKSRRRRGSSRGESVVRRLGGTAGTSMTTDEIMALTRGR